jgi:hypothetical protein
LGKRWNFWELVQGVVKGHRVPSGWTWEKGGTLGNWYRVWLKATGPLVVGTWERGETLGLGEVRKAG